MLKWIKQSFIKSSGYSYTHLGRMFLRMFVGIMLMQVGVNQIYEFDTAASGYPSLFGLSPEGSLTGMIILEIFCSFCIMIGFCTRIMIIPPFVAMVVAECFLLNHPEVVPDYMLTWSNPGYVPMLFMGIYFFLFLVGPGKISCDYFIALHFIHTDNKSEAVLEEQ